MKKLVKPVYAGINGKLNKKTGKYDFKVDFENNSKNDVVKFIEPYFQQSTIDTHTYWFGYSFNDGQSNPRRDEFIQFMKHVQPENWSDPNDEWSDPIYTSDNITEPELNAMIFRSMNRIHISDRDIDTIIYPESKSGNLVSMIVKQIRQAMSSKPRLKVEEVLKAKPSDIQFNFDQFHKDLEKGELTVPDFVTDDYIEEMMEEIHSTKAFSLRRCVHPVALRRYVSGFYSSTNVETKIFDSDVILIVDDFGTSGTTIRELIRVVRSINKTCEIYIFTLMGNRRAK